jgi:hypothetical protein
MELTEFTCKETNISKRKKGWKVGDYLAVAPHQKIYCKIYNVKTGLPAIDITFTNDSDAVSTAEWLDKHFGDYFIIWDEFPKVDIFALAKWSVPGGIQIFETLRLLDEANGRITLQDVREAFERAGRDHVQKWTRSKS